MASNNGNAFLGWGIALLVLAGVCFQLKSCADDYQKPAVVQNNFQPQPTPEKTKKSKRKEKPETDDPELATATPKPTVQPTVQPTQVREPQPTPFRQPDQPQQPTGFVPPVARPTQQPTQQPKQPTGFLPPVQAAPKQLAQRSVTCNKDWTNTGVTVMSGNYLVINPQNGATSSFDFSFDRQRLDTVFGYFKGTISENGVLWVRSRDRIQLLITVMSEQ